MGEQTGFSSIRTAQEAYFANFLIEGKIVPLDCTDITHIGLESGITVIYTCNKKLRADYSIAEVVNRLPQELFVRISRYYIVAPAHVDRLSGYIVIIGRHRIQANYFYRSKLLEALERVNPKPIIDIKKYT
jgi:DNA-binding LytR/AlgR family response regulator